MGKNGCVGARLEAERARLGISKSDFAEAAGISRKTLYNYISSGETPKAKCLEAWKNLGVNIDYILTGLRTDPIAKDLAEIESLLETGKNIDKSAVVDRLNTLSHNASDMQRGRIDLLLDLVGDVAAKKRRLTAQSEVGKLFSDSRLAASNAFDVVEWDAPFEIREIVFTACFHGMSAEGAIALVKMLRDLQKPAKKMERQKE